MGRHDRWTPGPPLHGILVRTCRSVTCTGVATYPLCETFCWGTARLEDLGRAVTLVQAARKTHAVNEGPGEEKNFQSCSLVAVRRILRLASV